MAIGMAWRRVSNSQWLDTGRTAETGQTVIDLHPDSAVIEVRMELRPKIGFTLQVRKDDIDPVRVMCRREEQCATTGLAEAARTVIRRAIADQVILACKERKTVGEHADPRNVAGPVSAAADRAVTMGAEQCRQPDFKADRATQASPEDGS
jgi:hypothetical protein